MAGANLTASNLSSASLLGVDFSFDDLDRADLASATLVTCAPAIVYAPECFSARFDDARLHGADLSSSGTSYCFTLDDPPLLTSTCGGAGFAGADLSHANLRGADLSFADLAGANLVRTDFTGALFASCPPSILELAVCSSTNLTGADLRRTSLAGLTLQGAQLEGADLSYADLTGTDLSPLVLIQGIVQTPSNLDNANFTHANFTHANLDGASTTGTNFTHPVWASTTCPDGTNSDTDGKTCVHNLL